MDSLTHSWLENPPSLTSSVEKHVFMRRRGRIKKNRGVNDTRVQIVCWDGDGPNGPDDAVNSNCIIVNFLSNLEWFNRCKGPDKTGLTEVSYCKEIMDVIVRSGITAPNHAPRNIQEHFMQIIANMKIHTSTYIMVMEYKTSFRYMR